MNIQNAIVITGNVKEFEPKGYSEYIMEYDTNFNKSSLFDNKSIERNRNGSIETERYGIIGLMCPTCFGYDMAEIHDTMSRSNNRTFCNNRLYTFIETTYKMKCPSCGIRTFIEIDANIIKTIHILNVKGYTTKFCCEGHYDNEYVSRVHLAPEAYISFKETDILEHIHTLPLTWYLDLDSYYSRDNSCVIRSVDEVAVYNKKEILYDIQNWAKSLPKVNTYKKVVK